MIALSEMIIVDTVRFCFRVVAMVALAYVRLAEACIRFVDRALDLHLPYDSPYLDVQFAKRQSSPAPTPARASVGRSRSQDTAALSRPPARCPSCGLNISYALEEFIAQHAAETEKVSAAAIEAIDAIVAATLSQGDVPHHVENSHGA